ncbi:GPP34 family phosphoprotein [Streptomyces sp. NBC_00338]|uniref:GOLPH3/VPS74 family protein n=1 Tax=Streptomyces sp. NBC_00338 TaxID=2975715 RepID=UPI00225BBAD3|nr:GPP34 family phosphoprotein [Streptomyces sp. NBC_00338]MCX5145005.1 GPP34 family phosphoprotein [Streptomyces sp. NBC_00338]
MTTARNLLVITMDMAGDHPVRSGELSLALAGAELIDLAVDGAVELREDRIVPGAGPASSDATAHEPADELLQQASAALRRDEPYESVGDWLWRRGEGLSGTYAATFEAAGLLTRQRRRGRPFQSGELVLAESSARHRAAELWSSAEPVLMTLAEAVGVPDERPHDTPEVTDDSVALILATVSDALLELEGERQKRDIEQKAFDNIWRGPGG